MGNEKRTIPFWKVLTIGLVTLFLFLGCVSEPPSAISAPAAPAATQTALATLYLTIAPITPSPTNTPSPTPSPTPTPIPTPEGLLGGTHNGFYYDGELLTENEYRSENLHITVYHASDETTYHGYIDYHVADIYVQDITLLKAGCAGDDFGTIATSNVTEMAEKYGALLAVSGDYCSVNNGIVVRNGVVYHRDKPSRDICVVYRDGTVKTLTKKEYDVDELLASDPWHVFNFGPGLLDENGKARDALYLGVNANKNNPRCVFGYYEPGHYAFCLIDGRQLLHSRGLDISDLAKFAENMGFSAAFNLDGGDSAVMCWQGEIYNVPSKKGGRPISDIIYFLREENDASE